MFLCDSLVWEHKKCVLFFLSLFSFLFLWPVVIMWVHVLLFFSPGDLKMKLYWLSLHGLILSGWHKRTSVIVNPRYHALSEAFFCFKHVCDSKHLSKCLTASFFFFKHLQCRTCRTFISKKHMDTQVYIYGALLTFCNTIIMWLSSVSVSVLYFIGNRQTKTHTGTFWHICLCII